MTSTTSPNTSPRWPSRPATAARATLAEWGSAGGSSAMSGSTLFIQPPQAYRRLRPPANRPAPAGRRAASGDLVSATVSGATSAQYSLTLRVEIDHRPGMLGKVASAIGDAGGTIGSVDLVSLEGGHTLRDITVDTAGGEHGRQIGAAGHAGVGAAVVHSS